MIVWVLSRHVSRVVSTTHAPHTPHRHTKQHDKRVALERTIEGMEEELLEHTTATKRWRKQAAQRQQELTQLHLDTRATLTNLADTRAEAAALDAHTHTLQQEAHSACAELGRLTEAFLEFVETEVASCRDSVRPPSAPPTQPRNPPPRHPPTSPRAMGGTALASGHPSTSPLAVDAVTLAPRRPMTLQQQQLKEAELRDELWHARQGLRRLEQQLHTHCYTPAAAGSGGGGALPHHVPDADRPAPLVAPPTAHPLEPDHVSAPDRDRDLDRNQPHGRGQVPLQPPPPPPVPLPQEHQQRHHHQHPQQPQQLPLATRVTIAKRRLQALQHRRDALRGTVAASQAALREKGADLQRWQRRRQQAKHKRLVLEARLSLMCAGQRRLTQEQPRTVRASMGRARRSPYLPGACSGPTCGAGVWWCVSVVGCQWCCCCCCCCWFGPELCGV